MLTLLLLIIMVLVLVLLARLTWFIIKVAIVGGILYLVMWLLKKKDII